MQQITRGYITTNIILRNEIYNNWESFIEELNKGPDQVKQYLCNIWNSITKDKINESYDLIDFDKAATPSEFNATTNNFRNIQIYYFTFPEKNVTIGQAKCVALAIMPKMIKYFTMEIAGGDRYSIGEWRVENSKFVHYKYGMMERNTINAFSRHIQTILNYQQVKNMCGLKSETISLINTENANFKDLFSICIGKQYSNQKRFIDFLGNYNTWNTDVTKGYLKVDERVFNVEYIGTTAPEIDNFWYSADVEKIIPDVYVDLILQTKKLMQDLRIYNYAESKIKLNGNINAYNLSMIYIAFAPENVTYFCGSGKTKIHMFVKKLPDSIFEKVGSNEFITRVMEIISTFDVNAKLMIKAFLIENDCEYIENANEIIADFSKESKIKIKFKGNMLEKFEY